MFQVSCLLLINTNQIIQVQASTPNPGPRAGHQMVYDAGSKEIVLFGGIVEDGDHTPLPNIWRYNFVNQQWRKITPEVSPSPRFNHKMVYIPLNHTVLLYGGLNTTNHVWLGDTWLYNLQTNEWINKNPGVSPPKCSDTGLIYDSHTHRVLLFGGFLNSIRYNKLYEYNINLNNWTEVSDLNTPSARYGHSLIYNNMDNMTYLFGGRTSVYKRDLWKYNQSSFNWSQISSVTTPPIRYWHDMTYVNDLNVGFLFGGRNAEVLDDTWFFNFDSSDWVNPTPEHSPSPRLLFSMIYNSNDKRVYLYGGMGESSARNYDDFWSFDFTSNRWEQIQGIPDILQFFIDYWWSFALIAIVGVGSFIGLRYRKNKRNDKK